MPPAPPPSRTHRRPPPPPPPPRPTLPSGHAARPPPARTSSARAPSRSPTRNRAWARHSRSPCASRSGSPTFARALDQRMAMAPRYRASARSGCRSFSPTARRCFGNPIIVFRRSLAPLVPRSAGPDPRPSWPEGPSFRASLGLGSEDLQPAAVLGLLADVLEDVRVGHDHLAEDRGGQAQGEALAARDDVALERAAREQGGLTDQVAGPELGDRGAVAQDEELAGEDDVEAVGPLAGAEHDGAGVDLEELELGGELDALGVVERPEQRAGAHPAIDQAIANEAEHGAQDVAVVGQDARQGVAIDAQELGRLDARHGRRARLVGHQRDLTEERAGAEPRQLDARRVALHRHLALDDDVERVARLAGAEQDLAALERDQLEVGDQRLERVARHAGEQRGLRERAGGDPAVR